MPTLNWIGKNAVVRHHEALALRLLEEKPAGPAATKEDARPQVDDEVAVLWLQGRLWSPPSCM